MSTSWTTSHRGNVVYSLMIPFLTPSATASVLPLTFSLLKMRTMWVLTVLWPMRSWLAISLLAARWT